MVVVPQPSVKGCGAVVAVAVDRSVGPAAQHRADEALCLAVGLRPVCAGAQVPDAHRSTGDRVHRRAISGAIVGEKLLDVHPVTLEERHGAAQESDRAGGLLVAENLGVGQARAVIDRDMHVFPADGLAASALSVCAHGGVAATFAVYAMSGTVVNPAELLDVDVDQLSGTLTLVAPGRLHPEPAELAHPDPREDPRDGRESHPKGLRDLRAGEPQPPERSDRLNALLAGAMWNRGGTGGAVQEPELTLHA